MFKGREEVRRPKRFTNIVLNTYHASTPKSPLQIRFIHKKLTISIISMQAASSITKSMNFFLVLLLLQYKHVVVEELLQASAASAEPLYE